MAANTAYGASAQEVLTLFPDYLEGEADRPALAISQRPLAPAARNALERSFESFGYSAPTCTYATLTPHDPNAEGGDITLDPQALFTLVEALDPLFIIAADDTATQTLAQAYRTNLDPNATARLLGRPAVTFKDLSANLATDQAKQQVWRLLKSLNA